MTRIPGPVAAKLTVGASVTVRHEFASEYEDADDVVLKVGQRGVVGEIDEDGDGAWIDFTDHAKLLFVSWGDFEHLDVADWFGDWSYLDDECGGVFAVYYLESDNPTCSCSEPRNPEL